MLAAQAKKPKQYFLAVVPPPPVYEQAQKLKHYFKERYNSKASLNSPPHVTLHMPFRWRDDKECELIQAFETFDPGISPFHLSLKGFNSFAPRVIFIDVVPNKNLADLQRAILRFCRRDLNLFNADYKDQPFHPHLTLAFRDLKKSMYAEAWKEFGKKDFAAEFLVTKYSLLKHTGKVWEEFHDISLQPGSR
jgi:2'-5' RNA ligase